MSETGKRVNPSPTKPLLASGEVPYRETWATYQLAWENVSSEERRRLLEASVSDQCRYSDPTGATAGRDELISYIEAFRAQVPGATFQNQMFIEHHGQSVAGWTLYDYDDVSQSGTSYARYASDGRLEHIAGFFAAPAADAADESG